MTLARKSSSNGLSRSSGQRVERAVPCEEPVRDQGVEVGVEVEVFAEGVKGEDHGGVEGLGSPPHPDPLPRWGRGRNGGAEVFGEALVGQGAEAFEEAAMPLEVGAEHFGQGQYVVTDEAQERGHG